MKSIFSTTTESTVDSLVDSITTQLNSGKKVLWLVSGGSGVDVTVSVANRLNSLDLSGLSVTLSDERLVPVGHGDENWQQLLDRGFALPEANTYRPLQGDDLASTARAMSSWLSNQASKSDYIIGLFGIGADGHTAGIKPGSSAVSSDQKVAGFIGDDFERITITPKFIKTIDEAIVQAIGKNKHETIRKLIDGDVSLDVQPAQILKAVPTSILYTDYKEDK